MTTLCGRAFGFGKIKHAVVVVISLALAATLGSVTAAAGTPALPLKPLDLRPPSLQSILLTDSSQAIASQAATPIDAEDAPSLVIVGAPQLQAMDSHIHVPQTGIASLYWALQHPTRAWRILLPAQ
jgi:hypothetical protein